jgi:hypothetical protein
MLMIVRGLSHSMCGHVRVMSIGRNPKLVQMLDSSFLVELVCLSRLERDSSLRTLTQACAQPITIMIGYHLRLAIYYLQCALRARCHAQPAAIAQILVNLDYLPCCLSHFGLLLR